MSDNPLRQLQGHGQSVWLDQLRRDWFTGQLQEWIEQDDVRGVTSNPSIFQAAIAQSDCYDEQLAELGALGLSAEQIYDRLTLDDIRAACDILLPVYESTGGLDGYVSHEVSPRLAYDTTQTVREARRLWSELSRPNVMIKIPATAQGLPAIRACLAEGINVNVTLMFSLDHYDAVAEAYLAALEERVAADLPVRDLASVASFFVSRVDTLVDRMLDSRLASEAPAGSTSAERLKRLRGKAAVANCKRAYRCFREVFSAERFSALASRGARPQRVLWASTSTKNPAYSDTLYVDELIGPHTVNTLPLKTLIAFREHGTVADTLGSGLEAADQVVGELGALGVDLAEVGEELLREGVDKFVAALDAVLSAVETKRRDFTAGG